MTKMLWLDMEMTGLDVEREVPLEVAAIICDLKFVELETFHAIVKQPQSVLDRMDAWNTEHHGASGLTTAVLNGRDLSLVERDLVQYVDRHFQGESAILCGNSISQDRLFINKYFPQVARRLHYRMLDVTSWKVIFQPMYGLKFEKKNTHRAIDDIRESMGELQFYMKQISAPALT
jgi:oligoribonuclease